MNTEKLKNVQQKLEAFLAQEKELKERAQRCFVSYLRSVYLMKNKEVFDIFKLQIQEYALSLGLAMAPRVRFLCKAQTQRAEKEGQRVHKQSEEEEELRSFKVQLRRIDPQEESQSSDSEDSVEETGHENQVERSKRTPQGELDEDENDDDLRDLDPLTVKRKDVFGITGDHENPEGYNKGCKKKMGKETKFKEAKKVLKRNFQVNTKVAFSEEGDAVQLWPPVQQAVNAEEEEEEVSGINVEKARERLKHEDQENDKLEYSLKVKGKRREKRMKAKAARREASKSQRIDEEEVLVYVPNDSEDEFDPSTLPDPDKNCSKEEDKEIRSAKRQHGRDGSDAEEQLLTAGKRQKVRQKGEVEHTVLDTGLSLAEDEELVLHLLGEQR